MADAVLVERIPVASAPVEIPEPPAVSLWTGWPLAALVSGVIAGALLAVGCVL